MARRKKGYIIGSAAMQKIQAVEGRALSSTDLEFLAELDRLKVRGEERTRRILRYVKSRAAKQ